MESILQTLLEITIYSAVLFAGILLLKGLCGKKMSPILHYALWLVLLARLMIPTTIDSGFSLFTLPENAAPIVADAAAGVATVWDSPVLQPQDPVGNGTVPADEAANPPSAHPAPQETQKASMRPTWAQILTGLWLVGMVGCLVWLGVLYAALRRRIRKNAAMPSKKLLALLEEVKGELGIKSNIRLLCLYEYGTPALLFPNTILMPVDALAVMNATEVKFALRHELTHFKRGDQFMNVLLSLLNAIYWFNPIVWIAFRLMRSDMETACDSMVTQRLNGTERNEYANLILSLFSQPEHRQIVLGMAEANTRKVAEQRIRGIFMRKSSKPLVKIVSIVTVLILMVGCFTTACVPKQAGAASMARPTSPRNEDTRTGVGTVSLAVFDKPNVDIYYACEYRDANAPVRDENNTVTPKQAALSGCAMLCDMFGADALMGAVGVRYCEANAARPYYEIYVQGQSMDTAKYAATVDAELGVATYCGFQEALTLGEKGAPVTLNEQERKQIASDCLAYASDLIETLYGVGYVSGDSRAEAIEPFEYDRYDLACRVMLNTGGFEDYYFEYLYDRDDADSPLLPLTCTLMEVREDGRLVTYAEKAGENAFPIERVKHIYRVLCGEAQPMQAVETAAELRRSVQSAKEMLRLAERDRNETLFAGKSASRQEATFDTEEQYIQQMEDAITDLPETRIPVVLDLIYAYRNAAVNVSLGEDKAALFSVANGMVSGIHFSDYGRPRRGRDYGEGMLQLTEAEAAAKGAQLLTDLGAEGYALARAETVTIDRIFTAQYLSDERKAKAWRLTYLLQNDPDFSAAKAPSFYPDGHKQAYVMITMDDEKIIALDWKAPTSLAFSWE